LIEVRGLTKTFGSVVAVRDVSFRIKERAITGLLGPNGAGKTTTLRMLAGVLGPSSGTITIAGHDIVEQPIEARANLGYLAETSPLYPEMRVGDYLKYRASLKGVKRTRRREAVQAASAAARCADVIDTRISSLSRGYRQRVGLADALLTRPSVLLLDEPTAGLDPNQVRDFRDLIEHLAESHSILLSTHVLAEVEASCSEAIVIHRGSLVVHDSLEVLRARRQGLTVHLVARDPERQLTLVCRELGWSLVEDAEFEPNVSATEAADTRRFVICSEARTDSPGERLEALIARLVQRGIGVREVRRAQASLEAVFAELTQPSEVTGS
jgi:ABC-2 type transport system ATP-binding protein